MLRSRLYIVGVPGQKIDFSVNKSMEDDRFECNTGCHTRGQPLDLRPCEPARRHATRPAVS